MAHPYFCMNNSFYVNFNLDLSFDLHLSNGVLRVPGRTGCYVLSTGCGTGKTECCKSIIRQRFNDGILYCVDTVDELDKMYQWIITKSGIRPEDVMIISGDRRHQQFLHQYRDNPEILMQKKVILITHYRFWTDLINYFLIYNPTQAVEPFDGDFQVLMARSDLRKFVIFDETPKFITPFFEMPRCMLASFATSDGSQSLSTSEIRRVYRQFFEGSSANPFPKETTKIDQIKRQVIFNMIPVNYGRWSQSREPTLDITYCPIHLAQPVVNTRILILEGAGNLLFQGSQYFQLLDIPAKYNSRIKFEEFPFGIKRREDLDTQHWNNFMSGLYARLMANQSNGRKTLVVLWRNQGKGSLKSDDTKFYDYVKDCLSKDPMLYPTMYSVIYFGAAECKSTNQFRDYSEIILAGDWSIPNYDTAKFNSHFGVNIDTTSHKMWFFVQLLTRIGIRLHDGKEYTVCYSDDFSHGFIQKLSRYLYNDPPKRQIVNNDEQMLKDYLQSTGIRANFQKEIIDLCRCDSRLSEHLKRKEQCSLTVTLDNLFTVIPRAEKKLRNYNNLIKVLSTLGISLTVI